MAKRLLEQNIYFKYFKELQPILFVFLIEIKPNIFPYNRTE